MDWDRYSPIFEWETNEINPYQNQDKEYYLKMTDDKITILNKE